MNPWREIVWGQFGAAIDMLENAIRACPERLWADADGVGFWYLALHTLYFLDVYLDESEEAVTLPPPFARRAEGADDHAYSRRLVEWAALDGLALPARPHTKEQTLGYLRHGHAKCRAAIAAMTDADAQAPASGFPWLKLSRAELHLSNMRHVQHHAAQMNLLLRQGADAAPDWVARAAMPLPDL